MTPRPWTVATVGLDSVTRYATLNAALRAGFASAVRFFPSKHAIDRTIRVGIHGYTWYEITITERGAITVVNQLPSVQAFQYGRTDTNAAPTCKTCARRLEARL